MNIAVTIELHLCNYSILGWLFEDGTVQAFDPITKQLILHANVNAWLNHWRDTH